MSELALGLFALFVLSPFILATTWQAAALVRDYVWEQFGIDLLRRWK